ncbi:MAG: hypothetical protein GX057_03495 [Clostridiales bacterium]|nr:hypothetical protein [Clostridiales bacterium]
MFGYVRAYEPELKMREYEYYRAVYCGLCRSYGKCAGCLSRFALSYDFVFLALVRIALVGEKSEFEQRRCAAHPAKKRNQMLPNPQLDFCARAAVLLTYHKLRDDISDENGLRRHIAKAALLPANRMRRRAAAALPGLDEIIEAGIGELGRLEAEKVASVDLPAGVFGGIVEDILSYGLEGKPAAVARQIGRHIGKWLYIADALDDFPEDIRLGRYNPFACLYQNRRPNEEELAGINAALTHELMEAELGFNLIDYGCDTLRGVISNILYFGMPRRIEEIMKPGQEKTGR